MICKNCSTNYDDNAPYCPYCGAPNDMAHGSQQSQNEYYNPNAQQGGQYYYNGQPNTQQPNYQYQQQVLVSVLQQMEHLEQSQDSQKKLETSIKHYYLVVH